MFKKIKFILLSKLQTFAERKLALIHPEKDISIFTPYVSGRHLVKHLTIQCANQIIPRIDEIYCKLNNHSEVKLYEIDEFRAELNFNDEQKDLELSSFLKKYNSDKSTLHNYHLIYTAILSRLGKIEGLLEFGIGTNNTSIANNMGANGSPGASLRAFHEFLPNASIIGADIDKAILFNEEGIQCFYVDQTDMTSFEMLDNQIASPLTLIIDDGLHLPNANLATLIFSLEKMKSQENGWFVVEDIRGESLPIWHLIAHILSKTYKCYIIRTKTAYVFAVEIVNSN